MKRAATSMLLSLALSFSVAPRANAQQGAVPDAMERPPTAASVADLLDEAETWRSRAATLDAEWLETRGLIEKAREAAINEKWQEATELAAKAKQQGELAVAQAKHEADAWRHRVLH